MAAFEVIALDTATPQLRAPGASDTYTFPRAVEMPLGTANGVLFLNGSKVVTSGSGLTFDGTSVFAAPRVRLNDANRLDWGDQGEWIVGDNGGAMLFGVDVSEQMRLTSTGLGIGTSSPAYKLDVNGQVRVNNDFLISDSSAIRGRFYGDAFGVLWRAETGLVQRWAIGSTEVMRLDASGNLGLGVTPSAWVSNRRVLEIGGGAAALALNGSAAVSEIFANAIRDTGGAYRYFANGAASYVDFNNSSAGGWSWSIAPSGTAGNAISFTQAMTLTDANRLLIGATADKTQEVLRIASSGQASLLLDNAGKTNGAFVGAFNDAALFGVNRNPSTGVFYNTSNYAAEIVALGSSSNSYIAFATANAANTPATERLRLKSTGQLRYVPLAADPAGAEAGDVYYNSSTNKLRVYNGTAWVDLH